MTRQTTAPLPDYRLSATNCTVRELVGTMLPEIDLNPPYQRGSVWTLDQRIGLVKSWLMGVPIPAIIMNDRTTGEFALNNPEVAPYAAPYNADNPIWAVIDGKQRIETGKLWFHDQLQVPASWFDPEWIEQTTESRDGPYVAFGDLTEAGQRRCGNRFMLPMVDARLDSVQAEAALYVLVNGGGTVQTPEDMANAARVASGGTLTANWQERVARGDAL